jgi:hypothetical protein
LSLALMLAVLLVPARAAGQGSKEQGPGARGQEPGTTDDVQALAYLGDDRPVLVRLHVTISGQPYKKSWEDYVRKLFAHADGDGDGTLTSAEAARVPSVQFLRIQMSGVIGGFGGGPGNVPAFADLDANKDGKATPEELSAFYRRSAFGPFQLQAGPGQGRSGAQTESLFKLLDADRDGKLSKQELADAAAVLHKLDLDENEMIATDEVVANTNPYGRQVFFDPFNPPPAPTGGAFLLVEPGQGARLSKALTDRYDRDRNGKVSRAEIGLTEAVFAALDGSKDGALDGAELAKWSEGPSDLELGVRLGQQQPARKPAAGLLQAVVTAGRGAARPVTVEVSPSGEKGWPLAGRTRRDVGGGVVLTEGVAQIDVRGADAPQFRVDGVRGFYLQQFKALLKDKKDYAEKAEVQASPYFQGLFAFCDRDGDSKLYERELVAFLTLMGEGAASFTTLTLHDHGAGFFELLDGNRDGRLALREMRTAWERVEPWDRGKAGAVSRDQVPRQYQLALSQGPGDDGRFGGVIVARGGMGGPAPSSGRGPLWFRKMDRNADGDVSMREWLGTADDFKRIDADADGLLTPEEAAKADRR